MMKRAVLIISCSLYEHLGEGVISEREGRIYDMRPADLLLRAVEFYIVPLMPRSALRDEVYTVLHSRRWDEASIYRGFRIRQKKGLIQVTYRGHPCQYRCSGYGELELPALNGYMLRHAPGRGDVVVDGGAYHGTFTVLAARMVGPEGKVIAFEPDGRNRERLRENINLNGLDNVIVVPKGLWSSDRRMAFCEYGEDFSALSYDDLQCNVNREHEANGEVDVVALDSELGRLGIDRLDFLKMDIEGSEIEAVKGARNILVNNNVKVAIASYHEVEGKKTCFVLEELLTGLGYRSETNFPMHITTYANKPSQ